MFARNRSSLGLAALAVVAVIASGTSTNAGVINLDVKPGQPGWFPAGATVQYVGLGAAPDLPANTFWNNLAMDNSGASLESISNLKESDGTTATTVGFAFTGGGTGSWDARPAPTNAAHAMMQDFAFLFTNTGSFEINGLTPAVAYDIYIYGHAGTFTIDGVTKNTTVPANAGTTSLTEAEDYVLFASVLPNGSNKINVDFAKQNNAFELAGLQIVSAAPVPEPSVAALMVGAIPLLAARRRRTV